MSLKNHQKIDSFCLYKILIYFEKKKQTPEQKSYNAYTEVEWHDHGFVPYQQYIKGLIVSKWVHKHYNIQIPRKNDWSVENQGLSKGPLIQCEKNTTIKDKRMLRGGGKGKKRQTKNIREYLKYDFNSHSLMTLKGHRHVLFQLKFYCHFESSQCWN
jgi:hypothetical protein